MPNYGKKGTGIILKENMTIAVEPMLTCYALSNGMRDLGLIAFALKSNEDSHENVMPCEQVNLNQ